MKIGDVSRLSGVPAKMIRYYESTGLIPAAGRRDNSYRAYGEQEVASLQFVRRARDLGFSLEETGELLALWRDRSRPSRQVKSPVEAHVADLTRRIDEMKAMRDTLSTLARACRGDDRPDCPILKDLAGARRKRTKQTSN
jgi:Cu(I)-responsive transcriptional regulator